MLNDWDFAQFFPNWTPGEEPLSNREAGDPPPFRENSSSSSSGATPPRTHRRNESDSALNNNNRVNYVSNGNVLAGGKAADPLFSSRMPWVGRRREASMVEPVLTEFSRKASETELLQSKVSSSSTESTSGASQLLQPRREKTDLDLRRLELKKELEDRRRISTRLNSIRNNNRPPLLKSTSEPCAPLTLQQVRQQLPPPPRRTGIVFCS